jgi:hypothetical protein
LFGLPARLAETVMNSAVKAFNRKARAVPELFVLDSERKKT